MTLADELAWLLASPRMVSDERAIIHRAVEALRAAERARRLAEIVLAGEESTAFQVGKRAMARELIWRMDERPSAAEGSSDGQR